LGPLLAGSLEPGRETLSVAAGERDHVAAVEGHPKAPILGLAIAEPSRDGDHGAKRR